MICFADWGSRGELARIWEICFNEPARPAKFFLNNYFRPQNCLVYKMGGKIAAVVYLLPAQIAAGARPVQAHYIYAAATLPRYRGHGYMAALLAAAALIGANRGDRYSAVLPANPGLYSLYQKSDYITFFKISTVSVPLETMCEMAGLGIAAKTLLTYHQMNVLRNERLAQRAGSVLWSDEAFGFAQGMGRVYGDRMVCSRTGRKPAYAFCRRTEQDTCMVLELMADQDTMCDLAASIISSVPAQNYVFRLPGGRTLGGQRGEISDFGMIKPIGGSVLRQSDGDADMPYLGLPLD